MPTAAVSVNATDAAAVMALVAVDRDLWDDSTGTGLVPAPRVPFSALFRVLEIIYRVVRAIVMSVRAIT